MSGGRRKENGSGSRVSTVINEEYKEAFRTKSYTEFCNKIQSQLETRTYLEDANSSSSSLPSPPEAVRLSEFLVEPIRETLVSQHLHFLADYFDTSLEAGKICESALEKLHQLRVDYQTVRSVIDMMEQKPDYKNWSHNQQRYLFKNLASFALHTNPFSTMTPEKFHDLHETHQHLLDQLTSKRTKTKKRKRITKFIKRAFAVTGCGALAVSLPLLAVHGTVGLVAVPVLAVSCLALFMMKKLMKREKGDKRREEEEVAMDAAARGVYILINDFDTMSRLVERLNDEMEHRKFAAGVCVRRGKNEAMKEVVREFQMHELGFMEQLEELEKQIYLCFLDINRSRRLLIQQLHK